MSIKGPEFLTQAQKLIDTSNSGTSMHEREAAFRTAISRAYYTVYHRAEDVAKKKLKYVRPLGARYHKTLWDHYKDQDATLKIGERGAALCKERVDADYHLHLYFGKDRADDMMLEAQELLKLLSEI